MSQDTRPATGPPPVSAGWTLADKYRALLIRDGSTQGFNSLAADVDGLLKPLLARLAAAEADRDAAKAERQELYDAWDLMNERLKVERGNTLGTVRNLVAERDAARAENAGLREELNKAAEDEASYSRRCSKVEDENVKLRAVLQQLADSDNANSDLDAKCAARRLLEAKHAQPG